MPPRQILLERLRSVEADDARGLRARVVDTLRELAAADFAALVTVADAGQGLAYRSCVVEGDQSAARRMNELEGAPVASLRLWDPRLPRAAERDRFVGLLGGPVPLEAVHQSAAYAAVYAPFVVTDHSRILLYEGQRFIGWLGVLRCDGRTFTAREHRALARLVEPVRGALAAADRIDAAWHQAPIHLVFSPAGRVELASRAAETWLDDHRLAGLRRVLPAIDLPGAPTHHFVDGFAVRLVELVDSRGQRHVHVSVEAPARVELDAAASLTERQREIANYVVHGATNAEVAAALGISENTVRRHLKDLYARLGIGSRTELTALLTAARDG